MDSARTKTPNEEHLTRLKHQAWRAGDLSFLLYDHQTELVSHLANAKNRLTMINCSRRWGKSFGMLVYAVQHCLTTRDAQVFYGAPTRIQVERILTPHMRAILRSCPEDLQPTYSTAAKTWTFFNGASLTLVGLDKGNHEGLRGAYTTLGIVDEGAFVDDLEYVVNSILMPQTLTCDGRIYVISTPPKSPAHPFTEMCKKAILSGSYLHRPIHTATHITPELIAEYCEREGGEKSTTWRREYLGEFVTDAGSAILPEFGEAQASIVEEWKRPEHFDPYVSADLGFKDMTFAVFAYWDFLAQKLIIEDELVMTQSASSDIAAAIKLKERLLYPQRRIMRIADCDPIIIADLAKHHQMPFLKTRRDDLEAQVAALRNLIKEDKLRIHPRCKHLVEHLAYGIWDNSGMKFARSGAHGHFDGVAAMIYLVRNVVQKKNPFPDPAYSADQWAPQTKKKSGSAKIFSRRPWHRK